MKQKKLKNLPVVMNHYVNESGWRMTLSPACFEGYCRVLAERGYRGIGLDEAEAYFLEGAPLPAKSLLLTFDDGYADNYFYALPALSKYGHKAVCFPVANRIEATTAPRAEVDDLYAGRAVVPPLVRNALVTTPQGFVVRRDVFLNQGECAAMEQSGIFTLAAHCRGHYGVFTSPNYKDFFRPGTQYRTFYRTEAEPVWGLPNFTVKPGLANRAFIPDPGLVEAVKRLVPQNFDDATDFFAQKDNLSALKTLVKGFAGNMGRYESDLEQQNRMWREIGEGKNLLEGILGRKLQTLCWPWGRYSEAAQRMALDAGFKVFISVWGGVNPPGKAMKVHRFESHERRSGWLANQVAIRSHPVSAGLLGLVGL
ncbi:polysaccharide deacetylase family protein [Desulfovibrio sp. OttesenSCG-928-F20]|nr:polysaccharide deacetylase family protein [Desulfovibrio sp. OttesenSCG-928-F20]